MWFLAGEAREAFFVVRMKDPARETTTAETDDATGGFGSASVRARFVYTRDATLPVRSTRGAHHHAFSPSVPATLMPSEPATMTW